MIIREMMNHKQLLFKLNMLYSRYLLYTASTKLLFQVLIFQSRHPRGFRNAIDVKLLQYYIQPTQNCHTVKSNFYTSIIIAEYINRNQIKMGNLTLIPIKHKMIMNYRSISMNYVPSLQSE